uniref:Uncharacterized protein n=1 Tax=Anguilla anguilla TaxID=7936 RepID=A0A0E9PE94_ANGAN
MKIEKNVSHYPNWFFKICGKLLRTIKYSF